MAAASPAQPIPWAGARGSLYKDTPPIFVGPPHAPHPRIDLAIDQRLNHTELIVQLFAQPGLTMPGPALQALLLLCDDFQF